MKRFFLLFLTFFAVGTTVYAAKPTKDCVAINEIKNKAEAGSAGDDFLRTFEARLQDAIVNTGKFDVVDNDRLYEIAAKESGKQEDGVTDAEIDIDFMIATLSIHGTVFEMLIESRDSVQYNQKYTKTTGTFAGSFQIYDVQTGKVVASKQIGNAMTPKIVKSRTVKETATSKDTTKLRKHKKLIEPEKVVENSKGEVVVVPAKYEEVYYTTTEEKIYNDLMQEAVEVVTDLLMEYKYPLSVMSVSKGKVYINLPEERAAVISAEKGSTFEILQLGDELIDPDTGEVLDWEADRIMIVEIDDVRPKYITGKPIEGEDNMPLLEKEMKAYKEALKNAKTNLERSKIKSPFQVRVIKDKKEKTKEDNGPSIDDFFDR